jgi:hypothetical protein
MHIDQGLESGEMQVLDLCAIKKREREREREKATGQPACKTK